MAAIDYLLAADKHNLYLCNIEMIHDRRIITESEIIEAFGFYLRKWCAEHEGDNTVVVTNSDGKRVFIATLIGKPKSHDKT